MPICTKGDTDEIFSCLSEYLVEYSGKVVTDTLELNQIYYDFDNWEIMRKDGTTVSKKKLGNAIDSAKIGDIKALWSTKYENGWNEMRKKSESEVLCALSDTIPAFVWLCNKVLPLHEVKISKNERELPIFENVAGYFKHCYILKSYRKYLNDEGVIYSNAIANLKNILFHFLVSDGVTTFVTSDNPAFICSDGKFQRLISVNPRILLAQGRDIDRDEVYYGSHICDDAVKAYNNMICQNAKEFVITDDAGIEHF